MPGRLKRSVYQRPGFTIALCEKRRHGDCPAESHQEAPCRGAFGPRGAQEGQGGEEPAPRRNRPRAAKSGWRPRRQQGASQAISLATSVPTVASPTRSLWSPRIHKSPAREIGVSGSSGTASSSVSPSAASCAARRRASSSSSKPVRGIGSANGNRTRRLAVQLSPVGSKSLWFQSSWYSGMVQNTATER
jgi:hypothetical protein